MKLDRRQDIDALFAGLPEHERITALLLRDLVKETLPGVREKLSWGAPFYQLRRNVCFIWPASIPWGKLSSGVALGFTQAAHLNHDGYLGSGELKTIGRHVYHDPEAIDVERVVELLQQAARYDAGR